MLPQVFVFQRSLNQAGLSKKKLHKHFSFICQTIQAVQIRNDLLYFQDNPLYNQERCYAFQCDLTIDSLDNKICDRSETESFNTAHNCETDATTEHASSAESTKLPAKHKIPIKVDIVTMIFVLSAIHPDKMVEALRNIYKVRDYPLHSSNSICHKQ